MIKFTQSEKKFLEGMEEARLATSHDDIPHVKPVSFVFGDEGIIVIATDYDTRSFSNIKTNPQTSIVVDIYKTKKHKAVCIQGKAEIIESGPEFKRWYDIFYKKFAWVREDPWEEKEAPFVKIVPSSKISWGLR